MDDSSHSSADTLESPSPEEVKKYVRTYEEDIQAAKSTAPVPPPAPASADIPPPSPPASQTPEIEPPPPPPVSEAAPPLPDLEAPVPTPAPPPPSVPVVPESIDFEPVPSLGDAAEVPPSIQTEPEPEPIPDTSIVGQNAPLDPQPLQTYSTDFADRVQETHASAATLIAAEADAGQIAPAVPPPPASKKPLIIAVLGTLCIIGGGVGTYIAYVRYETSQAPVYHAINTFPPTPITVDERVVVAGSRDVLRTSFLDAVTKPLASSTVRLISITGSSGTSTGAVNMLSALAPAAPSVLVRNIDPAKSMVGVISVDGVQSPFFILATTSYKDTFSGLLSWEPYLLADLSIYAIASSTPAPRFNDEIVANHDVRILRDTTKQSLVLYGYWDPSTIIIARDPAAYAVLIDRLAAHHD